MYIYIYIYVCINHARLHIHIHLPSLGGSLTVNILAAATSPKNPAATASAGKSSSLETSSSPAASLATGSTWQGKGTKSRKTNKLWTQTASAKMVCLINCPVASGANAGAADAGFFLAATAGSAAAGLAIRLGSAAAAAGPACPSAGRVALSSCEILPAL